MLRSARDRLHGLLEYPWELLEYQRFLEAQTRVARAKNDMFAEEIPRFEPRPEDCLLALDDLRVVASSGGVRLYSEYLADPLDVVGVSQTDAEGLLSLMDGTHTAAEIAWQTEGLDRFLRRAFGLAVFAPAVVESLERRLSGIEITRFPASPYHIVRPYWDNMIAVREAVAERLAHGV
ncbi:hypothetical protein ACFL5O_05985, partial [Myxococcota bacterium]